jgi:hypothetical protein
MGNKIAADQGEERPSEARGGYVAIRPPFSDQSDADQSGADADRASSAEDQAASTADVEAALDDQRASDHDQETADAALGALEHPTGSDVRAYEAARYERLVVSDGRQTNGSVRAQTARVRRATAAQRDGISRPRMRSSAIRKRLIAEGVSAETAIRWCDAWEIAAERRGVGHDADYWSRGTEWIWIERAAGRGPDGSTA